MGRLLGGTCIVYWMCSMTLATCFGRATTAPGGEATRQRIISAWNHRQEEITTFRFSWSGLNFKAEGTSKGAFVGRTKRDRVPSPGVALDNRYVFVADANGRLRSDAHTMVWSEEQNEYVSQEVMIVFDGQHKRVFFAQGPDGYPLAFITGDTASELLGQADLLPIRLVYRPFGTAQGLFNQSALAVTQKKGVVEGEPCVILRHTKDASEDEVWVAPSKAFVPVRWVTSRRGRVSTQVDISYSEDADYGWVPTSWNVASLSPQGAVQSTWSATVTEYKLNTPIADSTFQIEYPVGTWVRNTVTDETYIVREEGDKRPIMRGEFTGDNYEELLHSDPPSHGLTAVRAILIVASVLCLAGGSAWLWQHRRRTG